MRSGPDLFQVVNKRFRSVSTFEIASEHPKIHRDTTRALNFMSIFFFSIGSRKGFQLWCRDRIENAFSRDLTPTKNRNPKHAEARGATRKGASISGDAWCFFGGKTEAPQSNGGKRIEIPRTSKTPDFTIFHRGDTPLVLWDVWKFVFCRPSRNDQNCIPNPIFLNMAFHSVDSA